MIAYNRGTLDLDAALEAYSRGIPVVVISSDKDLLHGRETLEVITSLGAQLECLTIRGISADDWKNSDWPEVLEAARKLLFEQGGFQLQ